MFFESKVKRVVDVEKSEAEFKEIEREPLEKGDGWALFLSALMIFGPILLFFGGLAVLLMVL